MVNSAPLVKRIAVHGVITKSNLPVAEYSVNPYVGCTHACKYFCTYFYVPHSMNTHDEMQKQHSHFYRYLADNRK